MDEPPSYLFLFIALEPGVLYIVLAAVLILFTSLASATEAAFFSLNADDLERLRNSSASKEKEIAELQTNPRLLLTTLTAWKYTMISASAVAFVYKVLEDQNRYAPSTIASGCLILTIAFTFFGVILPKVYGQAYNLSIARKSVTLCRQLIKFYRPLIMPLFRMSVKVENKLEKLREQSSSEELSQALQLASANKETSESEKDILQGIVNFGSLTVKQVMRLRNEISSVDISLNFSAVLDLVKRSGYSRIPVCRSGLDRIEGVLYIKDLLPFLNEGPEFPWRKLVRTAYFALETRKIDHLLKDFQEKRVHLALVVDEYGTLTGLITLEDIIEEIIGDINDEFDELGSHYQKIDNRTFIFDGKTSMHDFCKIMQADGPIFKRAKNANKSLGGMLRQIQGSAPKAGEPVLIKPFTFIVEKLDNRRIKKVRVVVNE